MLLSRILEDVEEGLSWARERGDSASMPFAVGSVSGRWTPFSGIRLSEIDGRSVAVLPAAPGSYATAIVSAEDFKVQAGSFLALHGDMQAVIEEEVGAITRLEVVVDQDIDHDGDPVNVMILQGYVRKAAARA